VIYGGQPEIFLQPLFHSSDVVKFCLERRPGEETGGGDEEGRVDSRGGMRRGTVRRERKQSGEGREMIQNND